MNALRFVLVADNFCRNVIFSACFCGQKQTFSQQIGLQILFGQNSKKFHAHGRKFSSGRKNIFFREKIYFLQGENFAPNRQRIND